MKKLKESRYLKLLAAFLAALSVLVFGASLYGIYVAAEYDMYSVKDYDLIVEDALIDFLHDDLHRAYNVVTEHKTAIDYDKLPDFGPNVYYKIVAGLDSYRNLPNYIKITDDDYYILRLEIENSDDHSAIAYVPRDPETHDGISFLMDTVAFIYPLRMTFIVTAAISFFTALFLLIYLIMSAGYKKGIEGVTLSRFDRIPYEIVLLIFAAVQWALIFVYFEETKSESAIKLSLVVLPFAVLLNGLFFIAVVMSTATRIRSGKFFETTLLYPIREKIVSGLRAFGGLCRSVFLAIPCFWRETVILTLALPIAAFLLFVLVCCTFDHVFWMVLYVLLFLFVYIAALLAVWNFTRITECAKKYSEGELEHRIPMKYLFLNYKKCAEYMNRVGDGMASAVEARMKGERFKTELITNVSHDIKTPITSIINYVDLLKKAELKDEKVLEYIDVLDRQSQRLKKLTGDLIEASKASSGVVDVSASALELNILLAQVAGEYSEKLERSGISLVQNMPDRTVTVFADGKLMWRVIDNLFSNICKYSLPGTRAYMTLSEDGDDAVIVLTNISREPVSVDGDELTERFVRGDASRHTEGSGLGLSIAKSLYELQGGKLSVDADFDLFKVTLRMKKFTAETKETLYEEIKSE